MLKAISCHLLANSAKRSKKPTKKHLFFDVSWVDLFYSICDFFHSFRWNSCCFMIFYEFSEFVFFYEIFIYFLHIHFSISHQTLPHITRILILFVIYFLIIKKECSAHMKFFLHIFFFKNHTHIRESVEPSLPCNCKVNLESSIKCLNYNNWNHKHCKHHEAQGSL